MAGALIVVRGSGDVGSAVAHRLFKAGFQVLIHDEPAPAAQRRGMAFTNALFEGSCALEDVTAERLDDLRLVDGALRAHEILPVVVGDFDALIYHLEPQILVDARMRKRVNPESQIDFAPLTIGLGPNFIAGRNVHWVVETQWGEHLGTVLCEGGTLELEGEPRSFSGHSRDRFVHSPYAGRFSTTKEIGEEVECGQIVAWIDEIALQAPLAGILRGLVHDGAHVTEGAKVVEIDPRGDRKTVFGIGERPGRIADGVLDAIREWTAL
ncbi:MAG: selenium-dependent molybdenum cofactor biosynthesis protein YqeB [Actinomycetota bacterium]